MDKLTNADIFPILVATRSAPQTKVGQYLLKFVSGPKLAELSYGVYRLNVQGPEAGVYTIIIAEGEGGIYW